MLTNEDRDEIARMPDAMLIHNMRCAEHILSNPALFRKANMHHVQARWVEMVAVATGRALIEVTQ